MSLDMDQYNEDHQATWVNFVKLSAYGTVGVVAILVLLALLVL